MPSSTMPHSHLLLDDSSLRDAAENMAIDEELSRSESIASANDASGFIRFYSWRAKCATFGYAQSYNQVSADNPGLPLIRRPTGGGTVIHGEDLTYSWVIFRMASIFNIGRNELYFLLHKAIQNALERLSVSCEIRSKKNTNSGYYRCFDKPVMGDLLLPDGRKVAGAAQKQTKDFTLIQGSIALALLNIQSKNLKELFISALQSLSGISIETFCMPPELELAAAVLAKKKYASAMWNRGRKI